MTSPVSLAYIIANKLGMPFQQPIELLVEYKQSDYLLIGPNIRHNALYTAFLYFYLDGGILGVIIISFILGMLCRLSVRMMYRYRNTPSLVLCSLCFTTSLFSITDYRFINYIYIVLIIILIRMIKKNKKHLITKL